MCLKRCSSTGRLVRRKKIKDLLEKAAEEIENLYGRETQLSEEIRKSLDS